MREALQQLITLSADWSSADAVPEVDWSRMRALEFQEILRDRDSLVQLCTNTGCILCGDFDEHVECSMLWLQLTADQLICLVLYIAHRENFEI
jgi:hypothetical protein